MFGSVATKRFSVSEQTPGHLRNIFISNAYIFESSRAIYKMVSWTQAQDKGKKLSGKSLPELFGQYRLFVETLWRLSKLRSFSVPLELKVLFQGHAEPGVPSKWCARTFPKYFQNLFLNKIFCRTFRKFRKLKHMFGDFALRSTSPWACLVWCTKLLLFVNPNSSVFDLLFSSKNKKVKSLIYVALFRRKSHISRMNFFYHALFPKPIRAFIQRFIVFRGTPGRHSGTFWPKKIPPTWFFFGGKCLTVVVHNIRIG